MNNFLHPFGDLDVLGWYGKVAPYLKKFLQGKEIASKIVSDTFILIKRGTKYPPLFIDDFKGIDEKYLQLRVKYHLDEVVNQLSPKQIDLWQYFVPRKLIDFFYATNNEHGNDIDRIFIDIDRQDNSADDARIVTNELIKTIISDIQFAELIAFTTLILRTGSSFHIYIVLKKNIDHDFYDKYLSYGKGKEHSFINKRANEVSKTSKIAVAAGHERKKGIITLDSSNTPSGKLARCPFSLHIKDGKTIDGICVPISRQDLSDTKLIKKLQQLTPEKVRKNIDAYASLLP